MKKPQDSFREDALNAQPAGFREAKNRSFTNKKDPFGVIENQLSKREQFTTGKKMLHEVASAPTQKLVISNQKLKELNMTQIEVQNEVKRVQARVNKLNNKVESMTKKQQQKLIREAYTNGFLRGMNNTLTDGMAET